MKQNVALNISIDGLFKVPRNYLKNTSFKPGKKVAISFAKKYLFFCLADYRHFGAAYYTYVLDDGSLYLKNTNWNQPGVYEMQTLSKKKIRFVPTKI